jgi:hypothetical protein
VEVTPNFPVPCQHVLEQLGEIYGNDALAQSMTPEERLRFHQLHSAPVMGELRAWLNTQFEERKVEPNSGLGVAMRYLLKHWERLTLFLRQPGAALDNNICERALKKAILHRKNFLFYKTENGARVGDLFMSLIHTCELCGAEGRVEKLGTSRNGVIYVNNGRGGMFRIEGNKIATMPNGADGVLMLYPNLLP